MSGAPVGALLPPAGLALVALALLLARRWRSAAALLALLVALSMQGVAGSLLATLRLPPASGGAVGAAPDAIVILPGDASSLADPRAQPPSIPTLERLRTGAALQRRTALPVLVTGGREPDGRTTQAAAMAASLQDDFRVPVRWSETKSRNLWQSAAYSATILHEAGISDVFLVTDPADARLASSVFREAGLKVTLALVRRPDPRHFDAFAVLPLTITWLDSAEALRQWAGLACNALPSCSAFARR